MKKVKIVHSTLVVQSGDGSYVRGNTLAENINKNLANGWELHGQPYTSYWFNGEEGDSVTAQMMMIEETEEKKILNEREEIILKSLLGGYKTTRSWFCISVSFCFNGILLRLF